MSTQIFISYARDDDAAPPERSTAKGFISYLHEQLAFEFKRLGQPRPAMWLDQRKIDRAQQFDPVIADALAQSGLLLVVLSRNWLSRSYCLFELDTFAQRWAHDDPLGARSRIVVVSKNFIAPEERPPLLRGQTGYAFFQMDESAEAGQEYEFFERGQVRDDRYFQTVKDLGSWLWRAARQDTAGGAVTPPAPGAGEVAGAEKPAAVTAGKPRRAVYLAKPAGDMRQAYQRVVEELDHRGYGVFPPAGEEIPNDIGAEAFVDAALGQAEVSVHLIGERLGYAPENSAPITKLQLARAALRAQAPAADKMAPPFRRIVWAPRTMAEDGTAGPPAERDPLAVLARFDGQIDGDKIESRTLTEFITFLIDYLDHSARPEPEPQPLQADANVYLYHQSEDTDYALELARAMKARHIRPVFPALEGDPAQIEALHRKRLADCDAVVLCWGSASEVWVHAQSDGLKDWRDFGRKQRFAFRSVIAGPPPGTRKRVFVDFPPSDEIDLVLDLTALAEPLPESLDPLVKATHTDPA